LLDVRRSNSVCAAAPPPPPNRSATSLGQAGAPQQSKKSHSAVKRQFVKFHPMAEDLNVAKNVAKLMLVETLRLTNSLEEAFLAL